MSEPANEVSYFHNLAPNAVRRVRFVKQRSKIVEFVVQLECLIQNEWRIIIRYDTVHGFAHRDTLRPDGSAEKTALPFTSYNETLTFAQLDIKANWQTYLERYERWLQNER